MYSYEGRYHELNRDWRINCRGLCYYIYCCFSIATFTVYMYFPFFIFCRCVFLDACGCLWPTQVNNSLLASFNCTTAPNWMWQAFEPLQFIWLCIMLINFSYFVLILCFYYFHLFIITGFIELLFIQLCSVDEIHWLFFHYVLYLYILEMYFLLPG